MSDKYINKFHNMNFTTNSSGEENLITNLSKGLDNEKINDDFSNEDLINFSNPTETQNSKNILINSLQQSDKGHDYQKKL